MAIIRITKQFTFEMAHALVDYDGLCKNIHGHSYHFDVTVKGIPIEDTSSSKNGMLIDFMDLKNLVNQEIINLFDHALVISDKSNPGLVKLLRESYDKVHLVSYQPTSENLLADFAGKLQKKLPHHVQLFSLRLRETDSSFAEWFAEDNV